MNHKKILTSLVLFTSILASAASLNPVFSLLPKPQSVVVSSGNVSTSKITHIILPEAYSMAIPANLDGLRQSECPGIGIVLTITDNGTPDHSEGYVLTISKNVITVSSKAQEGLFYGLQTLSQLVQDADDNNIPLPCAKITDYPDMDFRAIHIDTKHHLDRMQYYYDMVDRLASYKVNNIIWELEDKLRYVRHPEIAAGNAISKQEMQALCSYAKDRNIIIHPLVQGLGHAPYILKHHWELREDPKSDWEMCPTNPKTFDFLFDLYEEALEAMPYSKYLHIGGDEITAIGICDRCKETGKSAFELQMEWLSKVCDFAVAHGKTPIFWDDMPLKYSDLWWLLHRPLTDEEIIANWNTDKLDGAVGMFPKNCIYMRWEYDDPTKLSHKNLLAWYKKHDMKVFAATAASSGETPFIPRMNSRVQYIKDFCSLASENDFDGIMATAWDDESNHYETVMRGFAALGSYSWNVSSGDTEKYISDHAKREWGLGREDVRFIDEMEKCVEFFDSALVVSGVRNPAYEVNGIFELVDLPFDKKPGEWSEQYKGRLDAAHIEEARYTEIAEGIHNAKSKALRSRYAFDVYEVTNELFHYPVKLLLALEAYDKAEDSAKTDALTNIRKVCDSFQVMKDKLIDVYGKTRFMSQAEGYIQDLNHHHHLSAFTFNSDWIFYFEQPMTVKIQEWLSKN